MKISRSVQYGMIAAGYIAQHYKDGLVVAERVSEAYNLPLEYLLKIMQQLVRADVLTSKRGPRGGFSLARPADQISLLELVEAVEGPMVSDLRLAEQTGNEPFSIRIEQICRQAYQRVRDVYAGVKLSEMIGG
jgi:Rrf2 family protein